MFYDGVSCEAFDDCSSNPCQNGGTCTNSVDGFECACLDGYDGRRCGADVDECASSPCRNGGTCSHGIDYYNCTCSNGISGANCEVNIDDCGADSCANGGTCVDAVNGFECVCPIGFTGERCESEIDECLSNPCLSGTCANEKGFYVCHCDPGYTGSQCETELRECQSNPCRNNGTCNDLVGEYMCLCKPGFTGALCEENIDECESNPCRNRGTCVDHVDGYTCRCIDGYTGEQCETDVDECASMPCRNDGTCSDDLDGYRCACLLGFTGDNCEVDVNECSSFPCQNGGGCNDGVNGYNCECVPGFTGSRCEEDVDECASNPCLNDGTCTDNVASYSCSCLDGFTGDQCQHAMTIQDKFNACGVTSGIVSLVDASTDAFGRATFNGSEVRRTAVTYSENTTGYVFAADVWQQPGNNGTVLRVPTESPDDLSITSKGDGDRLELEVGTMTESFALASPLDDGAMHRFVVVVTDVEVEIFVDGKRIGRSRFGASFSGLGAIELGGKNGGGDFVGFIGDASAAENDFVKYNSSFAICVSSCHANACANGGVCIDDYNGRHHCVCPADFTGDDCSTRSDSLDETKTARFYGVSYLEINNTLTRLATNISVCVRTKCKAGLIYYTRQLPADAVPNPKDYFAIRLVDGKVEFSFRPNSVGILTLTSEQNVDDNQWHCIQAVRNGLQGTLVVDDKSKSQVAGGDFDSLDATGHVCVGGVPDVGKVIELGSSTGFNGCIRDLIEDGTLRDLQQHLSYRAVGFGHCQGPRTCD